MGDLLATPAVIVLGAILIALRARVLPDHARGPLALAFIARVGGCFALVLMTKYFFGGGDMLFYHIRGSMLARLILDNPQWYAADTFRYMLGYRIPDPLYFLSGMSTGSMTGLAAWVQVLLGGNALYGACMVLAILNLWSNTLMLEVFTRELPERYHKPLVWLTLLLPSMVFWTSGLLKEAVAMVGLGMVLVSISDLVHRKLSLRLFAFLPIGAWLVGAFKGYILFPFILGSALWIYADRTIRQTGELAIFRKPVTLVLSALAGVLGLLGLGKVVPRYAISNLVDEAVFLQDVGARIQGGSSFVSSTADASVAGQLARLPLTLLTALFRPLPFDIHNAAVLLNAVEMVGVMWLWWRMARVRPWRQTARLATLNPFLLFSILFVAMFAAAVGIASTNMGTLSRYRVPMMPMYLMVLWVLGSRLPTER